MPCSTLARRRFFGPSARYAREGGEGGGGGGTGTGGTGGTGGSGTGSGSGGGSGPNGSGGGTGGSGGSGGGGSASDRGYPEGVPLEQMTVEQREAYWRHYARYHEGRANARGDYDELKRKAGLYDEVLRSTETASEQQLREAREAGIREAAEAGNRDRVADLLTVALEARGKSGDDLTELVNAANPAAFITDGKVDRAKVSAYAAKIAPAGGTGGGGTGGGSGGSGMGQGQRGGDSGGGGKTVAAGRELYRTMRPRAGVGTTGAR